MNKLKLRNKELDHSQRSECQISEQIKHGSAPKHENVALIYLRDSSCD